MPDPGFAVHPIEAESYSIMTGRVDLSKWPDGARDVVARMIHATADETFADSALIGPRAVQSAVTALRRGVHVVCDSKMVVAGVPAVARTTTVGCYLDRAVETTGSTRSAAAIDLAAEEHRDGAVWVIGNAPTALTRLLELVESGGVTPAVVIGLPVGYVGAAEAKAALWASDLRDVAITNVGPRGGSPVAAAALNALGRLAFPPPQSAPR